jgi:hypothetical protein
LLDSLIVDFELEASRSRAGRRPGRRIYDTIGADRRHRWRQLHYRSALRAEGFVLRTVRAPRRAGKPVRSPRRGTRDGRRGCGWRARLFPPHVGAEVIAMACELPVDSGVPLSRWSSLELAREAITRGIVEQISGVTVWRWLSQDAIKPWQHRSWIFPRDPLFAQRALPILDLYAGTWQGERLHPGDYVVCADEKPSIQARKRKAQTRPARHGEGQKVEHEYERTGALCYLAAWDARRAKIFDRCAANYFARKNSELGARLGRQPLRSSVVTVAPRIGRLAEECQQ